MNSSTLFLYEMKFTFKVLVMLGGICLISHNTIIRFNVFCFVDLVVVFDFFINHNPLYIDVTIPLPFINNLAFWFILYYSYINSVIINIEVQLLFCTNDRRVVDLFLGLKGIPLSLN